MAFCMKMMIALFAAWHLSHTLTLNFRKKFAIIGEA